MCISNKAPGGADAGSHSPHFGNHWNLEMGLEGSVGVSVLSPECAAPRRVWWEGAEGEDVAPTLWKLGVLPRRRSM